MLGGPEEAQGRLAHKNIVVTLVERGGSARSFHIDGVRAMDLQSILQANLSREAQMMTDEMGTYKYIAENEGLNHQTVNHSKDEYIRYDGDRVISTTLLKATSRSSSAARRASISIAARSTCTAIWPSLISAIPTVLLLALMTTLAPNSRLKASSASVLLIDRLTAKKTPRRIKKPARRFLAWRSKIR